MTPDEIIAKARSFIGVINHYAMGTDHRTTPGSSDCSAFLWLVLGKQKEQLHLWWNTDRIYGDATGTKVQFEQIPNAEPGCIAVYGKKQNNGHTGHVAIVVDPTKKTIIDCSDSKNGVAEHVGAYWWNHPGAVFARYKAITATDSGS